MTITCIQNHKESGWKFCTPAYTWNLKIISLTAEICTETLKRSKIQRNSFCSNFPASFMGTIVEYATKYTDTYLLSLLSSIFFFCGPYTSAAKQVLDTTFSFLFIFHFFFSWHLNNNAEGNLILNYTKQRRIYI